MELSKIIISLVMALPLLCCSCSSPHMTNNDIALFEKTIANVNSDSFYSDYDLDDARMSIHGKNPLLAMHLYNETINRGGFHNFEHLQQLAIQLINETKGNWEPSVQLLSIFGSWLAHNKSLLPILENGLISPDMQVQIASLRALSDYHEDQADQLIFKALNSNFIIVRLEAAYLLASQKHPEILGYLESQMNKLPPQIHFIFPSLFALLDTPSANKTLKKFFSHTDEQVRIEAILSAARHGRDQLLPEIRSLAAHHDIFQQEACAYALGILKDESSIEILEEMTKSSAEHVALSAYQSLYLLGRREAITEIERFAQKENLYAIAFLGDCSSDMKLLESLLRMDNPQVRFNAALALLKRKNPICIEEIRKVLIQNPNDTAISITATPSKALQAKRLSVKTKNTYKTNPYIFELSDQLRREILTQCVELPENVFLSLVGDIINSNQTELIPHLINLIENLHTTAAMDLLKEWQQKAGAPLIRAWSNLALYHLDQDGPWRENIIKWVQEKHGHQLIQLRPIIPWDPMLSRTPFELNTSEASQLLIESYLAISERQDEKGLQLILQNLLKTSSNNKYALAGILIRAAE